MLNRSRLRSKKTSKTEAVQSVAEERLDDDNIHIGPSDYVPWQNDNKVCFLRMEGKLFGDVADESRTAPVGRRFAELRRRRHRHGPLREARARTRPVAACSTVPPPTSASIRRGSTPTIRRTR